MKRRVWPQLAALMSLAARLRFACDHREYQTFGRNIHRCDSCAHWWTTPLGKAAES